MICSAQIHQATSAHARTTAMMTMMLPLTSSSLDGRTDAAMCIAERRNKVDALAPPARARPSASPPALFSSPLSLA